MIKGTFTPEEAKELLFGLLDSRIKFHNLKNWRSRERYGKPDAVSEEKSKYFEEARKNIESIIFEATAENKNITVNSSVEMSFVQPS